MYGYALVGCQLYKGAFFYCNDPDFPPGTTYTPTHQIRQSQPALCLPGRPTMTVLPDGWLAGWLWWSC